MIKLFSPVFLALLLILPYSALATSGGTDLEAYTSTFSRNAVVIGFALLGTLLLLSMAIKNKTELIKELLFWPMVLVVGGVTIGLAASTIYLNTNSSSKGPIHWHADFEVWACGQELELKDPTGRLSNKIGSPSRHEHNDKRLHYEGVVVKQNDAALGSFIEVLGGELSDSRLVFPTNTQIATYNNGAMCNGTPGQVQTFVYNTNKDGTYSQHKLAAPFVDYIMSPESQVPNGDCIIIEFDNVKEKTDRMCQSYETALETGKLKGETHVGY